MVSKATKDTLIIIVPTFAVAALAIAIGIWARIGAASTAVLAAGVACVVYIAAFLWLRRRER